MYVEATQNPAEKWNSPHNLTRPEEDSPFCAVLRTERQTRNEIGSLCDPPCGHRARLFLFDHRLLVLDSLPI